MPTREELLIEANRRGLLTGERKRLLDEAVQRGLISPPADVPIPQNVPPLAPLAPILPFNVATVEQNIAALNPAGIGEFALRQFIDNILSTPRATGTLLADASAATRTAAGSVPRLFNDQPLELGRRFTEAREEERQLQPAKFLRELPIPDTFDIQAAGRTAVGRGQGSIPERFAQQRDELIEADLQAREQRPVASVAGNMLGDAATLATGRLPFARAVTRIPKARVLPSNLTPSARRTLDRFMHAEATNKLFRGIRRAGETGFEGAVLAALDDADPVQTAMYSATAQAAGSTLLTVGNIARKQPLASLGYAALITAAGIQTVKTVTPGGVDSVVDSLEGGFDKVVLLGALATAAGLAGAGRGRGTLLAEELPKIIEGGTALLRGSMLSIIKDATKEDERGVQTTFQTLQHLAADPGRFTEPQLAALEKGFKDGNLSAVAQRLVSEDENFAQIIDSTPRSRMTQDELRQVIGADIGDDGIIRPSRIGNAVARSIGRDRARRLGFEARDIGPKRFLASVFKEAGAVETLRKRLSKNQLNDALTANLDNLISASLRRDGDTRRVNGDALQNAWERLPGVAKELYSDQQQAAIQTFIDAADGLIVLPPEAARALMMDGELTQRLLGGKTQ